MKRWPEMDELYFVILESSTTLFCKSCFAQILVPFVQFWKREKHPWRSVALLKVTLHHGCFSRFLNCTNDTKSIAQCIIYKNKLYMNSEAEIGKLIT